MPGDLEGFIYLASQLEGIQKHSVRSYSCYGSSGSSLSLRTETNLPPYLSAKRGPQEDTRLLGAERMLGRGIKKISIEWLTVNKSRTSNTYNMKEQPKHNSGSIYPKKPHSATPLSATRTASILTSSPAPLLSRIRPNPLRLGLPGRRSICKCCVFILLSLSGKGEREVKEKDNRGTASGIGMLGSLKGRRRAGLRSVQLRERGCSCSSVRIT